MRSALALFAATTTLGFVLVPPESTSLASTARRWTWPADSASNDGLGGGLAFITEDRWCETLLPLFPEHYFVSCEEILDALQRAFATWSANHHLLGFRNVTGSSEACRSVAGAVNLHDPCPWEVYIGTADGSAYPTLAAYVINYGDHEAQPGVVWWQERARSPNGQVHTGINIIRRSELRVQTHICWYLDTTFCYTFSSMGKTAEFVIPLLCFFLFGIAMLCVLAFFLQLLVFLCLDEQADDDHGHAAAAAAIPPLSSASAPPSPPASPPSSPPSPPRATSAAALARGASNVDAARRHRPPRRRWQQPTCSTFTKHPRDWHWSSAIDYVSTVSLCASVLALTCAVFPIVFYAQIYLPCAQCYDFEAALAHELGHVLGFGHPDETPDFNLAGCSLDNSTCRTPFECARRAALAESGADAAGSDPSIMLSLTREAVKTCLAQSDVHGLRMLYPTCDSLNAPEVQCVKTLKTSGWLRLSWVAGWPLALTVLLLICPLSYLRRRDQRKLEVLSEALEDNAEELLALEQGKRRARLQQLLHDGLREKHPGLANQLGRRRLRSLRQARWQNKVGPMTPADAVAVMAARAYVATKEQEAATDAERGGASTSSDTLLAEDVEEEEEEDSFEAFEAMAASRPPRRIASQGVAAAGAIG